MSETENKSRSGYQKEYRKENYDSFSLLLPKGAREEIEKLKKKTGLTLGQIFLNAIAETYGVYIR